ncbi:MAG: YgiQ family radical SAM protein [Negativicutes bacterium]|jgi:uncharacterized radical SAM protein YgiQ
MERRFIPTTKDEFESLGWQQPDFILITGDAYVDHMSFGAAIIGRYLEHRGYKVAIISQPDWQTTTDFGKLGRPRLGFLITSGNLDSMLCKYTAAKKIRSSDAYSPGGKAGLRPDRAVIVYGNRVRELWKDVPVIIGGIEASLRRFAHYDYWSDKIRRSILLDSRADLLVYGMGELAIGEIADRLNSGKALWKMTNIPGTCAIVADPPKNALVIPSYEEVVRSKILFAEAFKVQYQEQDPIRGKVIAQKHGDKFLLQNRPMRPLTDVEMDEIYALPFCRAVHPSYAQLGVPALEEVKFSLVSSRGCFGGCNFCALHFHQGRIIQRRSKQSLVEEAKLLTNMPDFKGYIHDVGGPTANFRHPACQKQLQIGTCADKQCLFPQPCKAINADHSEYLSVLRELRKLPKIKKVFVRSGIRYDYLLAENNSEFLRELCSFHVSGQLKVAPEHVSEKVITAMGKSRSEVFIKFADQFKKINQAIGKEQYLVPYFMASHPGCGLKEALELTEFLRDHGYRPEQVQDFIPTPGSMSTCMYYTGIHPMTGEKIYIPRSERERRLQRALMQYYKPENRDAVIAALSILRRNDLIGFGKNCLVRPERANLITKRDFRRKK